MATKEIPPSVKSKFGRPTYVFPAGTYNAQFLGFSYYANNTKCRFKFYVLNDQDEITENICSDPPMTVKKANVKLFEEHWSDYWNVRSIDAMRNKWFRVEVIENDRGLNSVVDIQPIEDDECITIPPWCRDFLTAQQQITPNYHKNRLEKDTKFKVADKIRKATRRVFTNTANENCLKLLGVESSSQYIDYLSSKFREGMTVENWGTTWQIDHITPLSRFDLTQVSEVFKASHYTNTQPLFNKENQEKYNE